MTIKTCYHYTSAPESVIKQGGGGETRDLQASLTTCVFNEFFKITARERAATPCGVEVAEVCRVASAPCQRWTRGKQEWSSAGWGGTVGGRKRGAPGEASPPVLRRRGVQNRSAAARPNPTQPASATTHRRCHPPLLTPPTLLPWLPPPPSRSHPHGPSSASVCIHHNILLCLLFPHSQSHNINPNSSFIPFIFFLFLP